MEHLPYELVIHILEYDITFKENFKNCMMELKKQHRNFINISLTFNNVSDSHKRYFIKYDPLFFKFFFKNLK